MKARFQVFVILQKISIKYTATATIKRLKEIKFSHNPLLPFFSPTNYKPRGVKPQKYTGPANHKCNVQSLKEIYEGVLNFRRDMYIINPPFFNTVQ
jgi:hypothetical protein